MSRLAAAALRLRLVEELEQSGTLRSPAVAAAFLQVPRELFVPAFAAGEGIEAVYRNQVIVTKTDADGVPLSSSSEPQIMAAMLEPLELRDGLRVLEIGTGTGYNAALLKTLVGSRGRVVSVDVDRGLASAARRALRAGGYAVRVVCADGHDGYERGGPYDRIVATASSARIPRPWLDQLVDGGLLEVPLRLRAEGALAIATFRRNGARLESTAVVPGRFMPLRDATAGGPALPPVLTVRAVLRGGSEVVTRLGGSSLAHLSPRARELLAGVAATPPRTSPLGLRAASWPLGLYLSLELPERRLVLRYADLSIGVIGRGGRSLALVEGRWEGGDRVTSQRLLAHGETEAEECLRSALEEWHARGRPGLGELRVEVAFRGAGSRITHRWERSPRSRRLVPALPTGDNLRTAARRAGGQTR